MPNVPIIPESAPFTAEQRSWLNGFLAGLLSQSAAGVASLSAPVVEKKPVLILFGSQSGNAESLAKKLAKEAAGRGFAARAAGLDSVQPAELVKEKNVLLITSTWGEGDMPDNAAGFWNALNQNGSSPDLAGVNFSVLALGDKNYADTFCLAGRRLDQRLEELGAHRLAPRVDCDVDFDELAKAWSQKVWEVLSAGANDSSTAAAAAPASAEVEESASYSKKNPFPAALLANIKLNAHGSAKDTRHIALSLAGSGLAYEVGDALGVWVQNCPEVVESVIAAHSLNPEAEATFPDGTKGALRDALMTGFEIRHLLGKSAGKPSSAEEFVGSLRKLQPRLYSIASSMKAHPDEVHLTIGVVKYEADGTAHKGVASTFLAERLPMGSRIGVFIHKANHFRLPADGDTPTIMVGPGTGIAPFRAFLEERQAVGAKGKNWLLFGDQKRATDFLYHDQIQEWLKDGHLTRLDTAFSRDQAAKVYVQNRMIESAAELWRWLELGAHFYVCGDAKRMAKDVDAALHQVIREAGGKSEEAATAYVAEMKKTKRYARDVY